MREVAAIAIWAIGLWIIADSDGLLRFIAGLVRALHGEAP